jgi:aminoglycoside phosphotransferase (APT) family kinase protein
MCRVARLAATVEVMDMTANVTLPPDWRRQVESALAGVRPDLRVDSLRLLRAGMASVALLLESRAMSLVLRFPRSLEGAAGIEVESRLLPELAGRLEVAIPRFVLTAPNPLGPGRFCGYPLVPGESLPADQWRLRGLLAAPGQARRVAGLLDAVHAFPADRARELGVPEWDLSQDFTEGLARIRSDVLPLLPWEAARTLLATWEGYLGDAANFAYSPTLIHADVALEHLMVTGSQISGLIDFGDAAVSDPDYDLSFLWPQAGPDFVRRVQQHRGRALGDRLIGKLRFWALADPACDVLHGMENDMPDFRDSSIVMLRDRIAAGLPGAGV